jgi:uncharacterized protein YbjT (DUF2867 family)
MPSDDPPASTTGGHSNAGGLTRSARILVTGASGTVGSPLVETLQETDATVRVASRDPAAARDRFNAGVEVVEFDFAHPETWGVALEAVDRLFLLFPPSVGVDTVTSFLDAAERTGVAHVVFLSVLGAEKLPILPHRRIERHLASATPAHTVLRGAWFMQNLSGIHRPEIVDRDQIYLPAGDGSLGLVDARDVAEVAATVLTDPGHRNRAYDLTGPESLDFHEVAAVFSAGLDRRIAYADPNPLAFAWHMYRRGLSPGFVAFMVAEYSVVRLGRSGRTTDDVRGVLGRPPRSLRAFLEADLETFR